MAVTGVSTQSRIKGFLVTVTLYAAVLAVALTTSMARAPKPPADTLSTFDVSPVPPAPEAPSRELETPAEADQQRSVEPAAADAPAPPAAAATPPREMRPVIPAAPSPPTQAASPPAPPAPPPQPASAPEINWESRLLAHIDRHKRYPRMVGSRRPQGTALVLFRMNRRGAVLFARILRSSGSDMLDHAAIETVRRAAPLPAIPTDRPAEIQLSVPVEFYTR